MEWQQEAFIISTDKTKLDIPFIHHFLTSSYWAEGIPVEVVQKSIEGSLCFGIYKGMQQVGFARVITDEATFAYLADVFIAPDFRKKGLSKWLMQIIMAYPSLQGLRRIMLATRDAHGLYQQFGFTNINNPEPWMQKHNPEIYKKKQGVS